MKLSSIALLAIITLSANAQTEIRILDVKNQINDSVTICSKVFGGKFLPNVKGEPAFLDFGGRYPDAPLTLVIWGDIRNQFESKLEEFYKGAQVCLTGKMVLYGGTPEIIISKKEQIISAVKDEEVVPKK